MTEELVDASYKQKLLERFLEYVKIDTQSKEDVEEFPSTEKQKDLSRRLEKELKELGLTDVRMDEKGYVYGKLPANLPEGVEAPAIGLIAHVDTYPGVPGGPVKPQVIDKYDGGKIELKGAGIWLDPSEDANLSRCVGHTIVTTDGTTLLGADDKAGVAEIMTALEWLVNHPEWHHPAISVAFTPDEEVGRGADFFDVEGFGAKFAYTLDGADLGEIEDETFCADTAIVKITGYDVHPGYGKGKLVNAVRVLAKLIESLPCGALPETTEKKEPYLHPYVVSGEVSHVELKVLVRAFTVEELQQLEDHLRALARGAEAAFPGSKVEVEVKESYRNMRYKIEEDPRVVEYAMEAARRAGVEPKRKAIRGGTDGARLSYMGILTPNIWAGGQNFHSVREWVSLEWMTKAVETVLHLMAIWVERSQQS